METVFILPEIDYCKVTVIEFICQIIVWEGKGLQKGEKS